jgi:hypothetical protein
VLKRLQSTSNPFEIRSGASLNVLLDDLRKSPGKRVALEASNLPDSVLAHINVTSGPGNLGLLRDGGRFKWPSALQEILPADKQRDIEVYADTLVNKARNGKIEGHLLGDLKAELEKTTELLSKKMNEFSTPRYTEAKRFLRDFEDATRAIERGDTVAYFEFQAFMSKAPTLEAIVEYMASKGLKFAAATQGDEAAYQALHSALAAYDVAWNAQGTSPPPPAAAKD